MSVDALQEKIRKTKNPCVLCLDAAGDCVPPQFDGLCAYYEALLRRLKGVIPGVRVSFGSFALLGGEGLRLLARITELAAELGYYVILDAPELLSAQAAERLKKNVTRYITVL